MEITIRTSEARLTVTAEMYGGTDGWMKLEAHLPQTDMSLSELQMRLVQDGLRKLRLIEQALNGEPLTPRPGPHIQA
jgi:hypothetical protein